MQTEPQETPQADPAAEGPRRNARRRLAIAGAALAVLALVLYAMRTPHGKEEAAGASAECPGASARAAALAPFAHGEVAALAVAADARPLPELKFTGEDGAPKSLADFRGRTVLLNLWATWCVPCRQEMPALDRLEGKLGSKDFTVVAVNIDTAKLDRPRAFWKETGIAHLGFYADPTAEAFQVLKGAGKALGLPTTILVDPNGCAIGVMAGPAQWDSPEALALVGKARI